MILGGAGEAPEGYAGQRGRAAAVDLRLFGGYSTSVWPFEWLVGGRGKGVFNRSLHVFTSVWSCLDWIQLAFGLLRACYRSIL